MDLGHHGPGPPGTTSRDTDLGHHRPQAGPPRHGPGLPQIQATMYHDQDPQDTDLGHHGPQLGPLSPGSGPPETTLRDMKTQLWATKTHIWATTTWIRATRAHRSGPPGPTAGDTKTPDVGHQDSDLGHQGPTLRSIKTQIWATATGPPRRSPGLPRIQATTDRGPGPPGHQIWATTTTDLGPHGPHRGTRRCRSGPSKATNRATKTQGWATRDHLEGHQHSSEARQAPGGDTRIWGENQ